MRGLVAPSCSIVSAPSFSDASSHNTPAATCWMFSFCECSSCTNSGIVRRSLQAKKHYNPHDYLLSAQDVLGNATNLMTNLLLGSRARICKAPTVPSMMSSIRTPSVNAAEPFWLPID